MEFSYLYVFYCACISFTALYNTAQTIPTTNPDCSTTIFLFHEKNQRRQATSSPPSPTSNTTTPKVLLKCFNGGMVQDGVCICPDEWSGDTCSIGANHFLILCIMWEKQYISLFDWLILDLQLCPTCNVQLGFEIIINMFDVTGHASIIQFD